MSKRRVIIPELVTIANRLRSQGYSLTADKLQGKRVTVKPATIKKTDTTDKAAKFKFLCEGD